ncbi:hypothetical protein C8J56DRAFT_916968 [Mycena floridula]|nr:hypothetical protein C8J56DRAFT_916968 [Mycena floridula]
MSSPITISPVALEPQYLARLIQILHTANRRYQDVADVVRGSLKPTHHAKKRAEKLGLSVNVQRAVDCPQRQVSNIPLPVLDVTPSPTSQFHRRPALKVTIPSIIPAQASIRSSRAEIVLNDDCSHDLSSRFSVSPVAAPICRVSGKARADVPVDESPVNNWTDFDIISLESAGEQHQMSSPSSSASSGGGYSSYTSSSGPTTPIDDAPIMIRIKRKTEDDAVPAEKRPKWIRKEWAAPITQRRSSIRAPAPRKF